MQSNVSQPPWSRPQYLKPKIVQDASVIFSTSTVASYSPFWPSRMATFDFKKYLMNIDPDNEYSIRALSGGRVNITVRAIKTPHANMAAGMFPGHDSIILKYAPAFIAKDGEGAPFSTFRQVSRLLHIVEFPPCQRR